MGRSVPLISFNTNKETGRCVSPARFRPKGRKEIDRIAPAVEHSLSLAADAAKSPVYGLCTISVSALSGMLMYLYPIPREALAGVDP